jgi:CubicO group peptidase (beta-lactamase class C family)
MLHLKSLRLAFLFLFVFGWSAVPAVGQHAALEDLDAYIESAMADWEVPGFAIAIIKDGEVIYQQGFGTRTLGVNQPVDVQTLFPIASTTKAMTVAGLGMLVDEGKLSWDDPVIKHLPDFQLEDPYVTRHLTIRDLLTHRTGLARFDNLWIASPFDRAEIMSRLRHLPSVSGFRTGYGYNNLAYMLAGEVAAAASGMEWDDFMDKRLFIPLQMTLSTTRSEVVDSRDNVVTPHIRVNGEVTPVPLRNYDALGPAGSAFSNASEMANWVMMHLNHGTLNGRSVLDSATVAEMHAPQVVMNIDNSTLALFPDRHLNAYGLGWRMHNYHGRKVVQHTGLVNYTRTQVGMIPEEGIGYVAFANLTTAPLPTAVMYRVFDLLLEEPVRDWSGEYLARSQAGGGGGSSNNGRVQGTSPSLALDAYAGTYSHNLFGDVEVAYENGGLVLRYSPDYVADLGHFHFDTFRANWRRVGFGSANATFHLDAQGRVRDLELQGFTTFRRQR